VLRTTNSGKTWSAHHLPDLAGRMNCPSPATCYMTTLIGALKTADGFRHTQPLLARSAIYNQTLTEVSCPTTDTCYAAGSRNVCPPAGPCDQVPASFAATSDGGRAWHAKPKTPDLLQRLSCPDASTCLAIGGSNAGPVAVDRSDDGAQTWHQTTWQQISSQLVPNNLASDITCVAGSTCYLLATIGEPPQAPRAAVLVSHDAGKTWTVQTGLDAAAKMGEPNTPIPVTPTRISCPSVTACFVLATVYVPVTSPGQPGTHVVLLATTDGGATWTAHATPPDTVPNSGYPPLGQDLACPTTTTCYLLSYTQNPEAGNPNGLPGPVLVTHDAGATWQSSVVSKGEYLMAIACPSAQTCHVAGASSLFGTTDGGMSWQRESMADGTPIPPMSSIACPAVGSCYAIGGPEPCCAVMILATHPPGALRPEGRRSPAAARKGS
jgi:photosystem II stability/assembly factor-like uncharacterized protein